MWIKSQDKNSLTNYDSFWVDDMFVKGQMNFNGNNTSTLGIYHSNDRAKEVLNLIHDHICEIELNKLQASAGLIDEGNLRYCRCEVFEMPQE